VARNPFLGEWRITETDMWDSDALDLVDEASIRFAEENWGELCMIAITADLDYWVGRRDGKPAVEFSIEGTDEGDRLCGRGWAGLSNGSLSGHLFFHGSDDSRFLARRPS